VRDAWLAAKGSIPVTNFKSVLVVFRVEYVVFAELVRLKVLLGEKSHHTVARNILERFLPELCVLEPELCSPDDGLAEIERELRRLLGRTAELTRRLSSESNGGAS
jgi:hypothetical protein